MRATLLIAVVACACTSNVPLGGQIRAPLKGAALGVPGEGMEFEVSLRGITVGRVLVAVGQPGMVQGRRAIIIRTKGSSTGLVAMAADVTYELSTTLDLDRGIPIESSEEGTVVVAGKRHHHKKQRTWVDDDRHDFHSAVGVVRAWPVELGEDLSLEIKQDGMLLDATFHPVRREAISNHVMPAMRYDGTAKHGRFKFSLWISDDLARVPLRLIAESKLGTIRVELVNYEAPRD